MTSFIPIADLSAAQAVGADILNRTFVDRPDLPWSWYQTLRGWGFTPIPAEPDPAEQEVEAAEEAKRTALNAQVEEMSFKAFKEARERHWQPGENLPD